MTVVLSEVYITGVMTVVMTNVDHEVTVTSRGIAEK